MIVQAVGASRRVFELLDRESKQPPAGDAQPKGSQGGGEVIFENVWCEPAMFQGRVALWGTDAASAEVLCPVQHFPLPGFSVFSFIKGWSGELL